MFQLILEQLDPSLEEPTNCVHESGCEVPAMWKIDVTSQEEFAKRFCTHHMKVIMSDILQYAGN